MNTTVNKSGYLLTFRHHKDGLRTYAASDLPGLEGLIYHLTGREMSTFAKDSRGLPSVEHLGIVIAYPVHIWTGASDAK